MVRYKTQTRPGLVWTFGQETVWVYSYKPQSLHGAPKLRFSGLEISRLPRFWGCQNPELKPYYRIFFGQKYNFSANNQKVTCT